MTNDFNDSAGKKTRDYAFFLAAGKSHEAADLVDRIRREREATYRKLEKKFDSNGMFWQPIKGRFVFSFYNGIPEGWEKTQDTRPGQPDFAAPKPDSRDHMLIKAAYDMLQEYNDRDTLEKLFGVEPAPYREIPAHADAPRDFLIEHAIRRVADDIPYSAGSRPDPLRAERYCDLWGIRVPCDDTGTPLCTPPDAKEISFEEACNRHRAERFGHRAQPPGRRPGAGA